MRRMRLDIMLLILMALVFGSFAQAQPLPDSSAAIEAALAYTGLGEFVQSPEKREKHVSAVLETITDSILPSLYGEKTQAVWKVRLDSPSRSGPMWSRQFMGDCAIDHHAVLILYEVT